MPVALITQLLVTLGPSAVQLVTVLIAKWQTNGIVSAEEWNALTASLSLNATDHMKAQLTATGVALDSPQAVALLALVAK